AAVAGERRLAVVGIPADGVALVNGMQRVDDDDGAGERQAGRHGALAEPREHHGLRSAGETGFRDPGREGGEGLSFHRQACARAAGATLSPPTVTREQARPWPSAYFTVGKTRAAAMASASETSARSPQRSSTCVRNRSASTRSRRSVAWAKR